jgi:hypothetical protein
MKTTNQELDQLKKELKELEAKQTYAIKGGDDCCGPGKGGGKKPN